LQDAERFELLASRVSARLEEIPGVVAVVLGGSRARGAARPDSDADFGLYYEPAAPPAVDRLRLLARELDDRGIAADVTGFGEWGPWVNGGAWLEIDGIRVDWLYRDLDRVSRVIDACVQGRSTSDYTLGHPHGFHSHIYLGEVHHARVLSDRRAMLSGLKARIASYPPRLRDELVRRFLFDAAFMLDITRKPARRGDVFHVAGCLFRAAAALVQVLYAANERWFLNEKGAVEEICGFPLRPRDFGTRVRSILAGSGPEPIALSASCEQMDALIGETRALCERGTE
jgi:predicted nucleotidyltransferase